MSWKGICKDAGILLLFALIFLIPATCLFFADGGQIYGINYNPNNRPDIAGQTIAGATLTVLNEDIVPIDDGSEILTRELWEYPLRKIFMFTITDPMAYIPPSTSKFISLLYLSLGLCFFILYRRKKSAERPPDSRREHIYQCITKNPGISQQQIADATGYSRGSVRHHLTALLNNQEIMLSGTTGHPGYLSCARPVSAEELALRRLLAQKTDGDIIRILKNHPGEAIEEIAARIEISESTARWHMRKLIRSGIAVHELEGKTAHYYLTGRADTMYAGIAGGNQPA